jgi:4-hydroxy-3-polyprenylbenzoate decarboxylase
MIDATRKWPYPPVALPAKKYMEEARKIWEELGLPPLMPKGPWHGYSLGHWRKQNEEEAESAVRGDYSKISQRQHKAGIKI